MPNVTVLVRAARGGQRKASIVNVDGLRWTFVHVPPKVEYLDQQLEYEAVPRTGNVPLVEHKGSGLARIRLSWLLGFPDPSVSIEQRLFDLKTLCRTGKLLRVEYGPNESGWWQCVDLGWETLQRNLEGHATRADVHLELIRAVDPRSGALVDLVRRVG